jgi:iron complex transport system substrate-binding protein
VRHHRPTTLPIGGAPRRRVHRLGAAAGLLALVATACGSGTSSSTPQAATQAPATTPAVTYPITVQSCGKPVTIAKAPQRVVVDDTAVAEMLFALGVGDHIVGQFMDPNLVDALPQFKDQDAKVPSLGGPKRSSHAPSKEVLLAAQPDLVIPSFPRSTDAEGTVSTADLASIGAVAVTLSYGCPAAQAKLTIDDQLNDLLLVGEVFGVKDKAQKMVDDMRAQLADVQRRVANLPKPPVATFYYSGGKVSAFGGGIPDEIVRLAGGNNVWSGQQPPTGDVILNISNESFASKPVDVFVITNLTGISAGAVSPQDAFDGVSKTFPTMPASASKRWVTVSGHAQQPSLVTVDAVVQTAKIIHPEAY